MRNECIRTIETLALTDPRVVVVASDPGPGFMAELAEKAPAQLLIEGVCEQALVGMSAGLAGEGYYPFIIMLAVFGTRRCYEQLLLDFGLHKFAGCMVGAGGGLNYAIMGPTHIAVDDVLLTSAIPSSAVISPGDPAEAIALTKQARSHKGLSYMRLAGTSDSLGSEQGDIQLGKGRILSEAGSVVFISCGAATLPVRSAVNVLHADGIQAGIVHLHTIKPLDVDLIRRCTDGAKVVLCVEEHRVIGGLASAVLHAFTSIEPAFVPPQFASIGVDDEFPSGYGAYEDLMRDYGIVATELASRAKILLSKS